MTHYVEVLCMFKGMQVVWRLIRS